MLAEALAGGRQWLGMGESARLLDCYGIAVPGWLAAADPAGAGEAAERLGGRVALKAQGAGIMHKTELGAVRVGLAGAAEVCAGREGGGRRPCQGQASSPRLSSCRAWSRAGWSCLVGVVADPVFGPVLACGAGGIQAELLKDVAVRVCPLGPEEAGEMIRSLATFPLLSGFRGGPKADLDALKALLLRVERDGRRPPRDCRAGSQSGHGWRRQRHRGRRQDQGEGHRPAAAVAEHMGMRWAPRRRLGSFRSHTEPRSVLPADGAEILRVVVRSLACKESGSKTQRPGW